jgi:hypothetical protein
MKRKENVYKKIDTQMKIKEKLCEKEVSKKKNHQKEKKKKKKKRGEVKGRTLLNYICSWNMLSYLFGHLNSKKNNDFFLAQPHYKLTKVLSDPQLMVCYLILPG